jgi:hypothetical protein
MESRSAQKQPEQDAGESPVRWTMAGVEMAPRGLFGGSLRLAFSEFSNCTPGLGDRMHAVFVRDPFWTWVCEIK